MLQLVQFALKFLYLIVEQKKGSVPPIFALNSMLITLSYTAAEAEQSDSDGDDAEPTLAPYGDDDSDSDEGPVPEDQDVDADFSTVTRYAHEV